MNENETILIIDDEIQIRRLLEISLESNGYKTIFAANGKEGLTAAATHHPSLIILDLGLTLKLKFQSHESVNRQ